MLDALNAAESALVRTPALGVKKAREAVNALEALMRSDSVPTRTSTVHRHALSSMRRNSSNLLGIAYHQAAQWDAAHAELNAALHVAEESAARGEAHDAYVDLGGVLIDLAANHIRRGQCDTASLLLKRVGFMLRRAYRPSDPAQASLLNVSGLLAAALGKHEEAFERQQAAFALLCKPSASNVPVAWSHAVKAASVSALLAQGNVRAGAKLATMALASVHADEPDIRTACIARSNAAVAAVEVLRAEANQGTGDRSAVRAAASQLSQVAEDLACTLGVKHPEVQLARANAFAINGGELPPIGWRFAQHWQPLMGAALSDKIGT